jgi:two-component system sensor histidine kinase HydH
MNAAWWLLTIAGAVIGYGVGWAHAVRRSRRGRPRPVDSNPRDPSDQVIELSALTGGLAHEIRNPLSTLRMNLQLLGEDWAAESADPAELRRRSRNRLAILHNEADRLRLILNDFLRLVGRQEPELQGCDLNAVVQEFGDFYEPQAHAKNIALILERADQPIYGRMDPALLKQALLNLCVNAQEVMEEGGTLTLRTGRDRDGRARIEVHDTGPGFDEETGRRLFEPFFSRRASGTGLGLPITRQLVLAQGGTITASSRPGRGARFTITLPVADAES